MHATIEAMRHAPAGDVVEIGSWWGKSAALFVLLARRFDIGSVLCVDPWSRRGDDPGRRAAGFHQREPRHRGSAQDVRDQSRAARRRPPQLPAPQVGGGGGAVPPRTDGQDRQFRRRPSTPATSRCCTSTATMPKTRPPRIARSGRRMSRPAAGSSSTTTNGRSATGRATWPMTSPSRTPIASPPPSRPGRRSSCS